MNYLTKKNLCRAKAIDYQQSFITKQFSYDDIVFNSNYFYNQGKRYGLLNEFKENGII